LIWERGYIIFFLLERKSIAQ